MSVGAVLRLTPWLHQTKVSAVQPGLQCHHWVGERLPSVYRPYYRAARHRHLPVQMGHFSASPSPTRPPPSHDGAV